MTVINRAKFHHFPVKDTKVIDGAVSAPPPQADSVLKRPGEIGLREQKGQVKMEEIHHIAERESFSFL